MSNEDFKKIIEDSRKEERQARWEGTCLDYLSILKENPAVAQLAPGRIFDMVMQRGTEAIQDAVKLPDYDDMI